MKYTYQETISTNPKYSVWDHNGHLAGYTNTKGFIEFDEAGVLLSNPRKIEENADHHQQLKSLQIL